MSGWRAQKTRHMAGFSVFVVAGAGLAFAANAAQLCRPASPASTRTCAATRLCRFKPSPFPNKNGPHKGTHSSFGSGGRI